MSAQIRIERKDYYQILEKTQRDDELDITNWLKCFLLCFSRALNQTESMLGHVLQKEEYWSVVLHWQPFPISKEAFKHPGGSQPKSSDASRRAFSAIEELENTLGKV